MRVISIQGTVKILRVYKKSKDHMSRQRKTGILRNLAPKSQRKQKKKQKKQTELRAVSQKPGQEKMSRKDAKSYVQ